MNSTEYYDAIISDSCLPQSRAYLNKVGGGDGASAKASEISRECPLGSRWLMLRSQTKNSCW